jgi:hypothetical protein
MRRIIGTIGVTLAVAVTAVSAAPAIVAGQGPYLLPYIEQDNVFRQYDAVSLQTWRAAGTEMGGEVLSPD